MNLIDTLKLAEDLIKEHGLDKLGWRFRFDTAKRRFGLCSYRRKLITLSKELTLLNDYSHVRNTILHEIAHALVGSGHGHNYIWKNKAVEIGCTGDRCYSSEVIKPVGKYVAVCPNGHTHYKHKHRRNRTQSCGTCSNKYNPDYLLIWKVVK
jgi:predicted SprT family Zn-dependent metalloprotease